MKRLNTYKIFEGQSFDNTSIDDMIKALDNDDIQSLKQLFTDWIDDFNIDFIITDTDNFEYKEAKLSLSYISKLHNPDPHNIDLEDLVGYYKLQYEQWTPLTYAVVYSEPQTVKYLLDNGADVNKCDFDDTSPLYLAVKHKRVYNIIKLIENGAILDINTISELRKINTFKENDFLERDDIQRVFLENFPNTIKYFRDYSSNKIKKEFDYLFDSDDLGII